MFGMRSLPDRERNIEVEQFLFLEARLQDERKNLEWLKLLADDFHYRMPVRHTPEPDPKLDGTDEIFAVEKELSKDREIGFFDEGMLNISVRVARSRLARAWSESPAVRTRRYITNVEVGDQDGDLLHVRSNVLLYYSRGEDEPRFYAASRQDCLRQHDELAFQLVDRRVTPDFTLFRGPAMNFFL